MSKKAGDKKKAGDDTSMDTKAEQERYTKMIIAASEKAPEKLRPHIQKAAPVLAQMVVGFIIALPYIVAACTKVQAFVASLPDKIIYASLGFTACFFGGVFPATIAAVEAWSLCGGTEAIESCKQLFAEFKKVQAASKKDDDADDNKDGVADVDQLTGKDLLQRKVLVAVKTVNPDTVNTAISHLFTGYLGVLAALQVKFAKTVTLGQTIGENLYAVVSKAEPAIESMLPEEYRKWVPYFLRYSTKIFAVSVAWWVERVISAIHSAIRGGMLFSRLMLEYCHEKGYIKFPDHEKSYLDEVIGWSVAFVGFIFQWQMGFGAPFPFNVLLLPVSIVERFIIWSISM